MFVWGEMSMRVYACLCECVHVYVRVCTFVWGEMSVCANIRWRDGT